MHIHIHTYMHTCTYLGSLCVLVPLFQIFYAILPPAVPFIYVMLTLYMHAFTPYNYRVHLIYCN